MDENWKFALLILPYPYVQGLAGFGDEGITTDPKEGVSKITQLMLLCIHIRL